jgi:PAS domain S-box-containing protein
VVEIANDRLLEMWGLTYEQVIHKPVLEIFPELKAQGFERFLHRVFTTGEPFIANELPVTFNRGHESKTIFINLFYEPFRNENNEIEGIVAVGSDVTEQVRARRQIEEAENKLKIAVELAELGTWHLTLNDHFIEYSANVASWWGLSERGAYLPEVIDCIHPDDRAKVSSAVERAIHGNTSYEAEYRVRHAQTGQERFIHASGQIIYDDNREPLQLGGIARDVTLQKMTEQELEKLVTLRTRELQEVNADLVRSNENLRQFAYVASHDLQEPLRKIITYSDLILARSKETLSAASREYLSKIAVGSQRMSSLIKDLLEFSQAERKDELYTNVDLNQVLYDIRNDYDVTMAEKGATLEAGPLCVVEAIPLQMNQLFYNLVGNALKFARPDQPPRVKIFSRMIGNDEKRDLALDTNKAYCEITFQDNGIGFEPKFADQIFVLFQRLHARERYEGTGIGLALCKKIVENHKGIIRAESNEGEGAMFKVVLPLKVRDARGK